MWRNFVRGRAQFAFRTWFCGFYDRMYKRSLSPRPQATNDRFLRVLVMNARTNAACFIVTGRRKLRIGVVGGVDWLSTWSAVPSVAPVALSAEIGGVDLREAVSAPIRRAQGLRQTHPVREPRRGLPVHAHVSHQLRRCEVGVGYGQQVSRKQSFRAASCCCAPATRHSLAGFAADGVNHDGVLAARAGSAKGAPIALRATKGHATACLIQHDRWHPLGAVMLQKLCQNTLCWNCAELIPIVGRARRHDGFIVDVWYVRTRGRRLWDRGDGRARPIMRDAEDR